MAKSTGRMYTRDDIVAILDNKVAKTEQQWGKDYTYSRWAREEREKTLAEYDAGKVICVERAPCVEKGRDLELLYMSDGTVRTVSYGYLD